MMRCLHSWFDLFLYDVTIVLILVTLFYQWLCMPFDHYDTSDYWRHLFLLFLYTHYWPWYLLIPCAWRWPVTEHYRYRAICWPYSHLFHWRWAMVLTYAWYDDHVPAIVLHYDPYAMKYTRIIHCSYSDANVWYSGSTNNSRILWLHDDTWRWLTACETVGSRYR